MCKKPSKKTNSWYIFIVNSLPFVTEGKNI